MGDLARDTAVEGGEGRYRAQLSREWELWGPSGGYLATIALRAAGAHAGVGRPASLTCHFLNVADFDEVDLAIETLRGSKRAESVRISMTQRGRPILEALAWLVGEVAGIAHEDAPIPDGGGASSPGRRSRTRSSTPPGPSSRSTR